ncbi:MAG TPA: C25 family cysteine peptidase, partial [Candidatus Limnocylindrales bacterium]
MTRRLTAILVAAVLVGCEPAVSNQLASASPSADASRPPTLAGASLAAVKPTPGRTPSVNTPTLPPSVGTSVLYHLQLATDIDASGNPIGQATAFPSGSKTIFGLLGWQYVHAGTELKLRLFQGDRFVHEATHTVINESGGHDAGAGFVYTFHAGDGFPDGAYTIEVDYNGVPDEVVPFTVGGGDQFDAVVGSGSKSGPIPYASPSDVLVVTRAAVLRRTLGQRADQVLAAAARVGDLHDLDADGTARGTGDAAVAEVHRLLRAHPYKYLLIVGNDDTVPYIRVQNPLADSEASALKDWELPADWVPSDNPYTDLDADQYGTPDLAVARIPSSDDADLLLTQLSDIVPPDGSGFALINQERKSQAGLIVNQIGSMSQVRLEYSPPVQGASFGSNQNAANARYLYVLLHGIGVTTNAWAANTVAWQPSDAKSPLDGEWVVSDSSQVDAVTAESNPTSHGVVQIGACYGAWTLDTVQAPQHKTADNNLALHYLRSGTRAYVADTHLSSRVPMAPGDTPTGRTGFELLFWKAIASGMTPIDAFQAAKVGTAKAIDTLVAAGDVDAAKINLKTLHYMVYLG